VLDVVTVKPLVLRLIDGDLAHELAQVVQPSLDAPEALITLVEPLVGLIEPFATKKGSEPFFRGVLTSVNDGRAKVVLGDAWAPTARPPFYEPVPACSSMRWRYGVWWDFSTKKGSEPNGANLSEESSATI
jgi:hypothetical protein